MSRRLIVSDGRRDRELLLVGRIVVGRDPTCDIGDGNSLLSRRHAEFVEPGFEHPHTFERLLWLCERAGASDTRHAPTADVPPHHPLDDTQLAAARAPGGVVQVIAPAGSGKTTVLIERVRELLARGAAPELILCMTFNEAAALEMRERLTFAGVQGVAAPANRRDCRSSRGD